jgi:hypothetical protein
VITSLRILRPKFGIHFLSRTNVQQVCVHECRPMYVCTYVRMCMYGMYNTCMYVYVRLFVYDLISRITVGDKYKLWGFSLCNFLHLLLTSCLLGPSILLSALFLHAINRPSSPYLSTLLFRRLCLVSKWIESSPVFCGIKYVKLAITTALNWLMFAFDGGLDVDGVESSNSATKQLISLRSDMVKG